MRRLTTIGGLRRVMAGERAAGRRIALVPTMGALHAGHLANVRLGRQHADVLVVSIFVNPTQFGPDEDLDAYPRDLDADEGALHDLGDDAPDYVFAPALDEMYPRPPRTTVTVAGLTDVLCGASRPGHFDGVATVVTKLCNLVGPDVAVFGRKDFQQLQVIRALVRDLDLPVEVISAATVREPDGVAMSSRNAYLDPAQRRAARALSQGLAAAVLAARTAREADEQPDPGLLRGAAADILSTDPLVRTDYVQVLDPATLTPPDSRDASGHGDRARPADLLVAVAAYVGPARLIDNVVVGDIADEDRLLAATGTRAPP